MKVFLMFFVAFASLIAQPSRPKIMQASDRGVLPDKGDVSIALGKLLLSIASNGTPVELVLGKGTYRIDGVEKDPVNKYWNYAFSLTGMKNLTIRGAGAETRVLVTKPWLGFLSFGQCSGITLKDFTLDYETPAFTQGVIETVDAEKGTYTLRVDKGFPEFDHELVFPKVKENWLRRGVVYLPRTMPDGKTLWDYKQTAASTGIEKIEPGLWRIGLSSWGATWVPNSDESKWTHKKDWHKWAYAPGVRNLIQFAPMGGAFWFQDCKDSRFENLIIHASPSVAFRLWTCDGLVMRGCVIKIPDGSKRLQSVNADVLLCDNFRGPVLVENCRFEDGGDDQITINPPQGSAVLRQPAPDQLELDGRDPTLRPGDALHIIDQVKLVTRAEGTIKAVEKVGKDKILVTFVAALGDIRPRYQKADADRKTPDSQCDGVLNVSAHAGPGIIRNNYFRGGGSVRKFPANTLIEKNTFEYARQAQALNVHFDDQSPIEVPYSCNLTIRSNLFKNMSSVLYGVSPVLAVHYWPARPPRGRPTRGIRIEGNRFVDCGMTAMYLRGVSDVSITGNAILTDEKTLRSPSLQYWHANAADEGDGCAAIFLDHCEKTVVRDLEVRDRGVKTAVMIGKNAEAGERGVQISGLRTALGEDVPPVLDLRPSGKKAAELIGYFPLDGQASDGSGRGLSGAVADGSTWPSGKLGKAVKLSASTQTIVLPRGLFRPEQKALTVAFWVRFESVPAQGSNYIPLKMNGKLHFVLDYRGFMHASLKTVESQWYGKGTLAGSTNALRAGQWTHVAGVYDGKQLLLYLDGKIAGASQVPVTGVLDFASSALTLGDADALVDELILLERGLTPSQVRLLMFGPGISPLLK